MTLKEKIQLAWKNKGHIVEGFYNAYIGQNEEIKKEALRRLEICRTNQCGFHDPKGESEQAVFKGKESCGGCGCDLYAKCHAMHLSCYLKEVEGKEPLWEAVMTDEQANVINETAYAKQFKKD